MSSPRAIRLVFFLQADTMVTLMNGYRTLFPQLMCYFIIIGHQALKSRN